MSLRTAVLIIFVATVIYAATFIPEITHTADATAQQLSVNPELILACILSAALLLMGHLVRAFRDTILFSKAAKTTVRSQFAAFSIGSLCNAILPLRIGELMRADVLAQKYQISFAFSFVLICLERLVDAAILGALAWLLLGFNGALALMAGVLLAFILLIWSPPRLLKRLLARSARLLNEQLEAKVLFTFWSLEYGLKRTCKPKLIASYFAVSLVNWVIYLAAFFPAILSMSDASSLLNLFATSTGAYVALTTSLAPGALGDFTSTLSALQIGSQLSSPILLWAIAIVPISLIGLVVTLLGLNQLPLFRTKRTSSTEASDNKLSRDADISSDQIGFMKDYYSGSPLARKVARTEILGGPALLKYFTIGGSGALTFQSLSNDGKHVTKVVPQEESRGLKAQYQWLVDHACDNIAVVLDKHEDQATYSIDIAFEDSSIDALNYLHSHSTHDGEQLFDAVIATLNEHVWRANEYDMQIPEDSVTRVQEYIERNIVQSLTMAAEEFDVLKQVMECDKLILNGEPYPNIEELLDQLDRKDILEDLANFRISDSIHGDLICDNIIFSEEKGAPVILDPVIGGNYFDGPVFDFGKLSQSLQIGYEFLLRDTTPVEVAFANDGCIIWYEDLRTAVYEQMWHHVYDELAPRYLTASELRTVLFLGATNYFRRMKYQVVQYPQNALKFYAQGIRYLTEYIGLFDEDGPIEDEAEKD